MPHCGIASNQTLCPQIVLAGVESAPLSSTERLVLRPNSHGKHRRIEEEEEGVVGHAEGERKSGDLHRDRQIVGMVGEAVGGRCGQGTVEAETSLEVDGARETEAKVLAGQVMRLVADLPEA